MFRVCTLCALLGPAAASASVIYTVYIGAPRAMVTNVANVATETFNTETAGDYGPGGAKVATTLAFTNGTTTLGTYSTSTGGAFRVQANDQYGGASSPKITGRQNDQYFVFGAQTGTSLPVDLTLTSSYNYFGFWWSAGDANNGINFYSGNTFLARIATQDITAALPNTAGATVTSVGGTIYQTQNYYGDPATTNAGQNAAEPYAYIDIIFKVGTFDKITFDNSSSTGTGFESDNHAVALLTTFNPPASDVAIESNIPEPGTVALIFSGCVLIALGIARRRSLRPSHRAEVDHPPAKLGNN